MILAVAICFSWTAAVDKYGALDVTITDEDGVPLPGVTCTIDGPSMQGSKTAISNDRGTLRISLLPAGRWYKAVFELPGFKRVPRPDLPIELGKTTPYALVMETTAIEEEITVTAVTPVVDVKSATSQINIYLLIQITPTP